jgi:glycerol-3-phosphate dehydrogenase (NAD(P)+)
VKNVIAIAAGISDGLGLGESARAALITRGLAELTRLGVGLGGKLETFLGLAGAGDLMLTCTSDQSRNRKVGLALAKGEDLDQILLRLGHVAEGVYTAQEAMRLGERLGVETPITSAVCGVLQGKLAPRVAVDELMRREPKRDSPV